MPSGHEARLGLIANGESLAYCMCAISSGTTRFRSRSTLTATSFPVETAPRWTASTRLRPQPAEARAQPKSRVASARAKRSR